MTISPVQWLIFFFFRDPGKLPVLCRWASPLAGYILQALSEVQKAGSGMLSWAGADIRC